MWVCYERVVDMIDRYMAVTGANTSDVSMGTYQQLGSNGVVRLHSLMIASRLNRISRLHPHHHDDDDDDDDEGELRPVIRSSLLTSLSTLPLRDVVSLTT